MTRAQKRAAAYARRKARQKERQVVKASGRCRSPDCNALRETSSLLGYVVCQAVACKHAQAALRWPEIT